MSPDAGFWRAQARAATARIGELAAENGALRAQVGELAAENGLLRAEIGELRARIDELAQQVVVLSRSLFGTSSEQAPGSGRGGVGPVPDAGGDTTGQSADVPTGRGRGQQRGGPGHGRRDHTRLETEEQVHDLPEGERTCGTCGLGFETLGDESSEQIDWQVKITRIVHRRLRYRRRCACTGPRTVIAPVPPRPIPKGLFTTEFLARLLIEKHVLGRPVHRLVKALTAEGYSPSAGTLSGTLKNLFPLLEPLAGAIAAHGALAAHVHADETGWRVFEDLPGKEGHRWWLWVFTTADTTVFTMDPTRSARVLTDHLGIDLEAGALEDGRRLVLSSDFYTAYQCLSARVEGVDPLWCWAHIRRYFLRAGDAHRAALGTWRDEWLHRIAVLYVTHRTLAQTGPGTPQYAQAAQRFEAAVGEIDAARIAQSARDDLHPAAVKVLATLSREWEGLARHRDFPDLPLDNNTAERALRTPVVGRKNYYGSHAIWAAELAACVWTITATAEKAGLNAQTYLIEYLNACAQAGGKAPEGAALQAFLPWTSHQPGEAGESASPGDPDSGDPAP